MQLSIAMELGHTLKKFNSSIWLTPDGSCGCAFGGALLAIGKADEFFQQIPPVYLDSTAGPLEAECVREEWPWLTAAHLKTISFLAHDVERGEAPVEDIWAYVRTIEPSEDETMRREHVRHALEFKEELEGDGGDEQPEDLKGYPDPQFEANGRY